MKTVQTIAALREQVVVWRDAGERIALVPTMGNLHAGHLELVEQARRLAQRTVVSIFVNPLQFGAGEDFERYPRTLEADAAQLERVYADLLFAPSVVEVYPRAQKQQTYVTVPGVSDILCGASRPGHFTGVATVVCKLFNMVQPDLAVFGEKDFQQLLVIRRMVDDLCLPVEIIGVPTVREPDGLARSSRNGYLTPQERAKAPLLYRLLCQTAEVIVGGDVDYAVLAETALEQLSSAGFKPDYFTVRRASDLSEATVIDQDLVILVAARLGQTRLIDNLRLTRN